MIRRRGLLGAAAGATLLAGIPRRGLSQAPKKRIAFVKPYEEGPGTDKARDEFAKALASQGFKGTDLEMLWFDFPVKSKWSETIPPATQKAIDVKPDCIVVEYVAALPYVQKATQTIPIVAMVQGDPVGDGYAVSLQRPGGNITGVHSGDREVNVKRIELLKSFVPGMKSVGWIAPGGQLFWFPYFKRAAEAAGLNVRQVLLKPSQDEPRFELAKREVARLRSEGCMAAHFHSGYTHVIEAIVEVALDQKLALSFSGDYGSRSTEGLLFMYDARTRARGQTLYERLAAFVARVLRGEHPGEIAFEGPNGYFLAVNGKTAERIGRPIPADVSILANEVLR